jgi:hypothetical protein
MNSSHILRYLIIGAATAALAACGGGGDSGGSSPTAPTPPSNTGLTAPTLTIAQSLSAVGPLVDEMVLTYAIADEAQAAKALGAMAPGVGTSSTSPYNCSSGQITFTSNPNGTLDYTYVNCFDGTYTYNGTSQVTPTTAGGGAVTSYLLAFTNLRVSGPPAGLAPTVSGSVTCTPSGTPGQAPACTSAVGSYVWGNDASYASGAANGSHQCDCGQGTWNVTFRNFSATGGQADVFASNGSAVVTRTGAKTFTVNVFVGSNSGSYTHTLP